MCDEPKFFNTRISFYFLAKRGRIPIPIHIKHLFISHTFSGTFAFSFSVFLPKKYTPHYEIMKQKDSRLQNKYKDSNYKIKASINKGNTRNPLKSHSELFTIIK